ncbi:transcription factor 7-like 1-C [Phyllopteryx taeniolatus]|uniref:transcription factor 7-like 1-C n=1 Tax=Phyllopteryx taeniolatus TaxID=161469 RepID=UPI002AD59B9D|nr:transcription factor 7-like 1-C [Phyllopteryx taeniolatus]
MHGEVHCALHQEAPSCIHDLHGGFVKAAAPWQDSAAVNKVLGQLWKSLTPAEQLSYFQESERLSRIHATRYPDWTYRDNYDKRESDFQRKSSDRSVQYISVFLVHINLSKAYYVALKFCLYKNNV